MTHAAKVVKETAKRLEKREADRLRYLGPEVRQAMLWQEVINPGVIGMLVECETAGPAEGSLRWLNELSSAYLDYINNSPFYA